MKLFLFSYVQVFFIVLLVSFCYGQENSRGPKRTKTSPYAGIIPFIRTGRSQLQLPFGDLENVDNTLKRAKPGRTIMAFPRVGRSGTIEWNPDENWSNTQKRNNGNNNMNNGLWFGPRLGRLHKRQDYQQENPFSYFYIGDYTPRLGRESEEVEEREAQIENKENENF